MESFRFSDINWEFPETFKIIKKVPLIDDLEALAQSWKMVYLPPILFILFVWTKYEYRRGN